MKTIALTLFLVLVRFSKAQDVVITIPQGSLTGTTDVDREGNEYYKFLNIPYAKPPVGDLRFKAPVADEGWEGVRPLDDTIPLCFQCSYAACPGSEDCLYVHVYTPELPTETSSLKAVMVFIHGGGFTADGPTEGPKHLITKDIVLVTLNYRLGIFGSFSIDDTELGVPGNAGMKDQSLALKWVSDNIANFGGDPDNILIFGDSAGGASVHLQVLSPMNAGIFHKAICESGVAIFDMMNGVRDNGILMAEQLGIQTDDLNEMLSALQEADPWNIWVAEQVLSANYPRISTPLVEIESNEPAFLPEESLTLIQTGNYNQVPFIIGHNSVEGLFIQISYKQATGENLLITDFTGFIPPDLQIEQGSEEETIIAERIKNFYYGDSEPSRDDITQAVQLYTDFSFAYPSYRAAREHAKTAIYPVYFYYFSADTLLNVFKRADESAAEFPGASHSDEKGYLFDYPNTPTIEDGSVEELALERLVTLWTDFAKYSDPTPDDTDNAWPSLTADTFAYYHIDTDVSTGYSGNAPLPENMAFWDQIYDEYFPGNAKF